MIITLIGSKLFGPWFDMWLNVLTLHNHDVYFSVLKSTNYGLIEYADYVMILNRFAYIGKQTLDELSYAIELNKTIIALESWAKGNGINHNHFKEIQDAAKCYDVLGKMSPIDTFNFIDPWSIDILGSAGKLRNEAISIIKEKEIIALGYDSNNLKHYW